MSDAEGAAPVEPTPPEPTPEAPGSTGRAERAGHAHQALDGPRPEGEVRAHRTAVRLMFLILAPLAVWTVIAMVIMWPHDVSRHIRADSMTATATGLTLPKGEVTKIATSRCEDMTGADPSGGGVCANLDVRLSTGPEKGRTITVPIQAAKFAAGVKVGTKVVLYRVPTPGADPPASYSFAEFDRSWALIAAAVAFVIVVVAVARLRGLRSLVGLAFAGFILAKFMFPALVSGSDPIAIGLVGGSAIMFVVLYATHGFSARTTTALLGTLFGLGLSAGLGAIAAKWAHLTGVLSEDDYLLASTAPDLKLSSVVACGIIVAGLGVLNDVTITQASAVWELADGDGDQSRLFTRAMRIGRDHIASTVYTLAFATAGASLGTLLLIAVFDRPLLQVVQEEVFSTEILRALVGSIALVLAVPLTTAIGVAVVKATNRARSARGVRTGG